MVSRPTTPVSTKQREPTPHSRTASLPADPFTAHPTASSSFVTYEPPMAVSSAGTTPLASVPKRARGSLLLAAAASLARPRSSKGKKKAPPPPAQSPFMFSEVIEISAARAEDEDAERERLRDAAAQSIGLDRGLLEEQNERSSSVSSDRREHDSDGGNELSRIPTPTASYANGVSGSELPSPPGYPGYPATRASLDPFVQLVARIAKHHPPPSLLHLALARQWKSRILLLTLSHSSKPSAAGTVHLHVFKGAAADERELERVLVGADSVAYMADDEIGGRRGVVRIVSAPGAGEMSLHMADAAEAQRWIAAIKQAVLTQRSVRAGLGAMGHSPGGVEPRGDLDVMLSMRAQGMLASPTGSTFAHDVAPPPASPGPSFTSSASSAPASPAPAPAPASVRSSVARSPAGAVSALRGLFSAGSRPRSPSIVSASAPPSVAGAVGRSAAEDGERGEDEDGVDDSFGRAGTNLLHMLRTGASPVPPSPSTPTPTQVRPESALAYAQLDRKIMHERDMQLIEEKANRNGNGVSYGHGHGMRSFSGGTFASGWGRMDGFPFNERTYTPVRSPSLQPPPRRRAYTSSGVPMGPRARPDTNTHVTNGSATLNGSANGNASEANGLSPAATYAYTHTNASTAESFGLRQTNGNTALFSATPPTSSATPGSPPLSASGSRPSTRDGRPRTSLSSVSSIEPRSSNELSRSHSTRRWSRASALPSRLTPPDGALPIPPAASISPSASFRSSMARHPYAAEGTSPPSRSPSMQSSPQSFILNLRNARRASSGSARSASSLSAGAAHSPPRGSVLGTQRPRAAHRASMPPPQRPAPIIALPPTPASAEDDMGSPKSAPANRSSFRESLVLRKHHRLSLSPPTLPPASGLPPRPDETSSCGMHRRSSSTGSAQLTPVPASPAPPFPPFPPPRGPLPPTPEQSQPQPQSQSQPQTPTRSASASIKQRLRMLSSSAPAPPAIPLPRPPSPVPSTIDPYSVPSTPIGEPITTFQLDPSFLGASPPTPPPPRSAVRPPSPGPSPELQGLTSLSPPPRRRSQRMSTHGSHTPRESPERPPLPAADAAGPDVTPNMPLSLSPHTSAVSLLDV